MCYSIYLSTDSNKDLSNENNDLLHFKQEEIKVPIQSILKNEHQWYLGSKSICSCTFRHLHSIELGFSEPVDWYPEDDDEIAATLSFIEIARQIVEQGHQLDCIDIWEGTAEADIKELRIDLNDLRDDEFRFFENYHFIFTSQ
ncbi:MAG: hypothetical protein JSV69_05685 [Chloroflexota bacterium]|nr:MAG: hypothetical protein JSV69_05685 [Chloroflexota bacterium]